MDDWQFLLQSYKDNASVIMKSCLQWNLVSVGKTSASRVVRTRALFLLNYRASSVGLQACKKVKFCLNVKKMLNSVTEVLRFLLAFAEQSASHAKIS